jgi:hypothetical protein
LIAGYERLLELARREAELLELDRWEELASLDEERRAVLATLPEQAPAEAREVLEETLRLVESSAAAAAARLVGVRHDLAHVVLGRRAMSGYAAAGRAAASARTGSFTARS